MKFKCVVDPRDFLEIDVYDDGYFEFSIYSGKDDRFFRIELSPEDSLSLKDIILNLSDK